MLHCTALSHGKLLSVAYKICSHSLTVCVTFMSICVYPSMCNVNPFTAVRGQRSTVTDSFAQYWFVREKSVTGDS